MSWSKAKIILIIIPAMCLVSVFFLFGYFSLDNKIPPFSGGAKARIAENVQIKIQQEEPFPATLPLKLPDLALRTKVVITAELDAKPGDSLLYKAVFAPAKLWVNGEPLYETGQENSFPAYMQDPPTILSLVPLPKGEGITEITIEYLSPSQRTVLSLPEISYGQATSLLSRLFSQEGFSLVFSILLIFMGMLMVLIYLVAAFKIPKGITFLWLGLFSLAVGIWVFGECDLAPFILPYPVLLYNLDYLGLFLVAIPFLHFSLVILEPRTRFPYYFMLTLHYLSVSAVILLQFAGWMDFIKSLYWFHIITPLAFVLVAVSLLFEYFRHNNTDVLRFIPAVIILAASSVLELINYYYSLATALTQFFQLGVVAFVIALGFASGHYMGEIVKRANEKTLLECEIAATGQQLELQREQYQQLAENSLAIKEQRHDLKHQLALIRKLNIEGNRERLGNYINILLQNIPPSDEMLLSENYAVNAIASYYGVLAQKEAIKTDLHFAIPPGLDSKLESDLCIIIGNLLENALEACQKVTRVEPFICLKSRLDYDILTITVDNSFEEPIRKKGELFLSGKRKGEGIGISSVKAVAKKYKGGTKFEAKGNVFMASVYLQIK